MMRVNDKVGKGTADNWGVSKQHSRTNESGLSRERMAQLRFIVAGAGALGNEVVKALGLLGAGAVMVVDPDLIEPGNLTRSVFFRPRDCGLPKAETLCGSLSGMFPATQWCFRNCEIADVGLNDIAGTDLLLSCVDNDLARIEIAWIGLRLNIPVSDAGLGGPDYWHGRVSFFAGRRSACFCCKLSPSRRRELLTTAQATGNSCWANTVAPTLPSTPTMAAIFGSLQVDFGLRRLLELQNCSAAEFDSCSLEIRLDEHARLKRFVTPVSAHCPLHAAAEQKLFPLPHPDATARELIEGQSLETLDLDWPICVAARCLACGKEWQPMRRVAFLRRRGTCPGCGSRNILESENVARLDRNSAWADTPLARLGLPANHLYTVR
jgi:molybdopterin-synthase adenylyltransferase